MEALSNAEAIDASSLTDDELLASIHSILNREDRSIAASIAHIMEIEHRRLHLQSACSSLKDFCIRKLGMNEGRASRRINGAYIAKCFPAVLEAIADGRTCLSHVVRLRDHFTKENVDGLLVELEGCRTRRQMQELMARLAPKPDVEEALERLPETGGASAPVEVDGNRDDASSPTLQQAVTPLSPGRYRLTLTLTGEDIEILERLCDATAHTNPGRKAQPIVSTALKKYLAEVEKERAGTPGEEPRKVRAPRNPATITQATRRKVHRRDGGRCAYVDLATGERCPARALLQLDHRLARANGGTGEAENVRLLCQAHNLYEAELAFGREHVAACIARKREHSGRKVTREGTDAMTTSVPAAMPPSSALAPPPVDVATTLAGSSPMGDPGTPLTVLTADATTPPTTDAIAPTTPATG